MPGPRRTVTRGPNPTVTLPRRTTDGRSSPCCDDEMNPLASVLMQPKHAHVPEVPTDSNLIFELIIFGFSVMCLSLQYINLYKTVWWLPHSHANYALNFYLIDPYLAGLLIVVMSRRVICCFVKEVTGGRSCHSCTYWLLQIIKTLLVLSVLSVFAYTAYHVVLQHSLLYTLFLCYPLVTYVILFGINVRPLFSKTSAQPSESTEEKSPTVRPKVLLDPQNRDLPIHSCSMSPEVVREEVELLKTDFNDRIKQVLFNSMLCAYYMGLVPLLFAQNTLYYDAWWVGKHVVMVWISSFILFMVHYLPSKYVDVLHRCSLHLGRWVKVENRHAHVPYNAWSELQVWNQGALVKHVRGLFRAEGLNNSAEPGNGMHARFYFMFSRPLRVITWLLVITWGLIICQFFTLVQVTDWSHIIALAFLLFSNYYALFKLMRDRFVLSRAYKEEQLNSVQ